MSDIVNGPFNDKSPNNIIIDKLNKASDIDSIAIVIKFKDGSSEFDYSDMRISDMVWLCYYFKRMVDRLIDFDQSGE